MVLHGWFTIVEPKDVRHTAAFIKNSKQKTIWGVEDRYDLDLFFREVLYHRKFVNLSIGEIELKIDAHTLMILKNKIQNEDLDLSFNRKSFNNRECLTNDLKMLQNILVCIQGEYHVYYASKFLPRNGVVKTKDEYPTIVYNNHHARKIRGERMSKI